VWIVQLALRRPYTFVVLAMLIVLLAWWKSRACYAPQTNLVLTDGTKGGLLPVLRAQRASTLGACCG